LKRLASEFCLSAAGMPALILCTATAYGQASTAPELHNGAADAGLAEVVVTATRRQERLEDVPISVSAFTQEMLDAQGLRSIDDLTRLTPGVTFQRNGIGASGNYNDEASDINIRGIDSTAGTSTVGIYLDDTPIQSRRIGYGTLNAFPAIFDLDHVEVLRGPQGTLFGASSEGGTVRFITPQPGLEQDSGYVRSELSHTRNGDSSYELGGAFGGPIINDVLGYRVSVSYRRDGGYVDRVDFRDMQTVDANSNWSDAVTFRAALKWKVNDALSISPSFYYQRLYVNDTAVYWPSLSDPGADEFRNGNAQANPSTDPFYLAAIRADWDLGGARLVSNTSFYSRSQHSTSDYTQFLRTIYLGDPYPAPGDRGSAFFTDKQNNFYEEFRVESASSTAPLTWNFGVFLARTDENSSQFEQDATLNQEFIAAGNPPLCTAQIPCPNNIIYSQPFARVIDKQAALFGELGIKITEQLRATLGARVSRDEFTGESLGSGPDGPGLPEYDRSSAVETPVTPKGVLSWQPSADVLVYASVAKGFRVGGTDSDYGSVPSCQADLVSLGISPGPDGRLHSPTTYGSDSLWSYEIGSKSTTFERRLQVNASLYVIDWQNIQQIVYLPTCGDALTTNLGHVRSEGGDVDVQFKPTDAWTFGFSAAFTDAKYTKTSCLPGLNYYSSGCALTPNSATVGAPTVSEGNGLVGAPWTFLGSAEYVFPLFRDKGYVRADFQYATAQSRLLPTQDSNNAIYDTTIPGLPLTTNLSLRAGWRWNGADVSLFVQNLTDAHPVLFESRDSPEDDNLYFQRTQRPRTIGLTATWRY
jgi:iron complex outermembrane recepter protein